jgi:hypothetical protein
MELGLEPGERGWAYIELWRHATPAMVDGVVSTPQDPVVGRQSEVVELVVGIGQALASLPADRSALVRRQSG